MDNAGVKVVHVCSQIIHLLTPLVAYYDRLCTKLYDYTRVSHRFTTWLFARWYVILTGLFKDLSPLSTGVITTITMYI